MNLFVKFSEIYKYYSRREIREAIFFESRDREFCWMTYDGNFGKRPYALLNPDDIVELVKKKAVSFHISVERWENPFLLRQNMKKKEMDQLRKGWDLLIDVDSPSLELSKDFTKFLVYVLEEHGIKSYGLKFSGSKGFHIVIPFESFPKELDGKNVKNMFPELARIVGEYLMEFLKEDFRKYLEKKYTLDELSKLTGKNLKENFQMNEIVQIDSIVMSKRHLFRAPYSLNEKSWLVSVPIERIEKFDLEVAKPDYVDANKRFLPKGRENEAKYLFEVAYEWYRLRRLEERIESGVKRTKVSLKEKIPSEFYPPCIRIMINGLEDGRKRALFILTNFLAHIGWDDDGIEEFIKEWNERNDPPLKESYIRSQMKWFKKRKQKYVTPNCNNEGYYRDMGVCKPDEFCKKIRNPLSYVFRRYREWLRRQAREK